MQVTISGLVDQCSSHNGKKAVWSDVRFTSSYPHCGSGRPVNTTFFLHLEISARERCTSNHIGDKFTFVWTIFKHVRFADSSGCCQHSSADQCDGLQVHCNCLQSGLMLHLHQFLNAACCRNLNGFHVIYFLFHLHKCGTYVCQLFVLVAQSWQKLYLPTAIICSTFNA